MKPSFLLVTFCLFFLRPELFAQGGYLSLTGGLNRGEHIFETGNKFPNLSGITGGSRITYSRNFNIYGIEGGYFSNHWNFKLKAAGTGRYINPGNSRDEDFTLNSNSTEKSEKLIPEKGILYDSAYTYSGTRNFADGHARTSMKESLVNFSVRYYFNSGSANPSAKFDSFFISSGIHYQFSKYYLYDVIQYVNSRPVFLGPIGSGLSYSFNGVEIPLGIGYAKTVGSFRLEMELAYLGVYLYARDFHVQRALNFLSKSSGPGFSYKLDASYVYSDDIVYRVSIAGHRQFTSGLFKTKGGLYDTDILSNYSGYYKSYLSTKEWSAEFSITKVFLF